MLKVLYVGTLATKPDRDSGWVNSLRDLGCTVIPFSSQNYWYQDNFLGKIARRFSVGVYQKKLQKNLLKLVDEERPDWVHFRLPINFDRATIVAIKATGACVTQYFNDDPFSKKSPFGLHWKFRRAMTAYDGHFVYRQHNVKSYLNRGAVNVMHCPPAYNPLVHFGAKECFSGPQEFLADAAFIGHWENDERLPYIERLNDLGFSIILKGGMWDRPILNSKIRHMAPIHHAFGDDYRRIYANVIAGLCFFSKINNDTWTERALEIVAVGGLLVCERTVEAETYFKDRKEAFFFSSDDELVDILNFLKANPLVREQVREAGYTRLLQGSHTIRDRAEQIYHFARRYISSVSKTNNVG